jgi:hypothetical protein
MSVSSQAVAEEEGEEQSTAGDRTPRANGGGSDEETPLLSGEGGDANGGSGGEEGSGTEMDAEEASKSPFLGGISVGRFWLIFGQILLTYFTACFDGTIMGIPSLRPIAAVHDVVLLAGGWKKGTRVGSFANSLIQRLATR